jgi:lipid A disaccharide synthetase
MNGPKKKIMVVAGEASADLHASHLLERFAKSNEIELIGIGGDRLVHLGLQPLRHARDMAVVGFSGIHRGDQKNSANLAPPR